MGCVAMSQAYFGDGRIRVQGLAEAKLAAKREMEPVQQMFLDHGWDIAIGVSGSVMAVTRSAMVRRLLAATPAGY